MRVGILELLTHRATGLWSAIEHLAITKQFASVTAQAVSVWCRRKGHRVHYAIDYGVGDPRAKLPADLDVVFVSAATMMAPLAYALARVFAREGTVTVIGGPHAKAFPRDCRRYFDIVVQDCDEALVDHILAGDFAPGTVVSSARPYEDAPTIEERLPEIRASAFLRGRPHPGSFIPLLSSVGCPYSCDFCVDWNTRYRALSIDRLREDLRFASEALPGVSLGFLDPNFGVRFDEVLSALESIPAERRSPYIVESSLTLLKTERLLRLRDTRCAAVSPGIESWSKYSNKAAVGSATGAAKLEQVVAHFETLREYVPYLGANFIFGFDTDAGAEPFELTKEFLRRAPFVWPSINSPFPFGGTPMYDDLAREGRILGALPFSFYTMPHLVVVPKNYDPKEFVARMIDVYRLVASGEMLRRRTRSVDFWVGKASFVLHTFIARQRLRAYEAVERRMATDPAFLAFHRGERDELPGFYAAEYRRQLGRYAELVPIEKTRPVQGGDVPVVVPSALRAPPLSHLDAASA